ncbi:MAG: helix-turn-helix domain-containing protein [Gammaproteobacteria bacterium]|nr:helix-turn-helix domain-containing protein [Gammaproteobacteria bacterium]MBU1978625.1 helix-turn-helix domain-containing protein [Gammaproteobacteria bacterium]
MDIGSIIERLRKQKGLSQDELADKAGTTKSNLSRIEKDNQWPRPDTLEAITAALDIKVYQLFAIAEGERLPVGATEFKKEEWELIGSYRAMEEEQQSAYLALAKAMNKKP